jgi:hypothetical protein
MKETSYARMLLSGHAAVFTAFGALAALCPILGPIILGWVLENVTNKKGGIQLQWRQIWIGSAMVGLFFVSWLTAAHGIEGKRFGLFEVSVFLITFVIFRRKKRNRSY